LPSADSSRIILEADECSGGRLAGKEEIKVNGWIVSRTSMAYMASGRRMSIQVMLQRHEILPQLDSRQEEQWIYRTGSFIGRAPIGSVIRNSRLPAPLHYIQLFLVPQFLWMLDIRDWAGIFNVWSTLVMAIGIDPFVEDQPLEGLTFGETLKRWGPAMRALFFGLTRNGLSTDPDKVPLAGFLAFLRFYTLMRRDAWAFEYLPNGGGEVCEIVGKD
jgi:carotenoid phi-ring synthase / carotenoid chi-ring synthase